MPVEETIIHLEDVCVRKNRHVIYQVRLTPAAYGLVDVTAWSGRPGRVRIPHPLAQGVSREDALAIANTDARARLREGYVDPAKAQAREVHQDMLPALLTPLHDAQAWDPAGARWMVQVKHDGVNRPVRLTAQGPLFYNREAQLATGNEAAVNDLKALFDRVGPAVLFCEDMGPAGLQIFDLVDGMGVSHEDDFATRNETLGRLQAAAAGLSMIQVCRAITLDAFTRAGGAARLLGRGAEGYVLKRADAPHRPGRTRSLRDAWMLKVKFVEDATFRVAAQDDAGRRVVAIESWDADEGTWVRAGRVSVPAAADMPQVGDFADVRYLYASAAGVLTQPVWKSARPGATPDDCRRDKLKVRATR